MYIDRYNYIYIACNFFLRFHFKYLKMTTYKERHRCRVLIQLFKIEYSKETVNWHHTPMRSTSCHCHRSRFVKEIV